jgi:hypothetical protein
MGTTLHSQEGAGMSWLPKLNERQLGGRRCVVEPADVLNPRPVGGQIAWASSVNAAATRVVGGASTASS